MNRPGESGDSGCCLAGLCEGGILTVVDGLKFSWRDVAAGLVEPPVVEPVDILKRRELDLLGGAPGPAGLDQLSLIEPDHRLGEGVVVGIADGANGSADAGQYTSRQFARFCQANGIRTSVSWTGVCWDNAAAERRLRRPNE